MSLLYLLLLVLLALVLQRLSLRRSLDGLDYAVHLSRQTLECGETFTVTSSVSSRKFWPVLFLRLVEQVPPELAVSLEHTTVIRKEKRTMGQASSATLEQTLYLLPKQKVTRSLEASLPARGRYLFLGATLCAGDLLGLEERTDQYPRFCEAVVLPPRIDAPDVDAAFGNYLGDVSVRRFILSDPILTIGFREYTGREPQRDISWPRSMRDNRLMVKQYDYTAEMTATVLLNIGGGTRAHMERCYSLARCVCEHLEARRVSYDFLTNACTANAAGCWSHMSDGLGSRHLCAILEGLGRATYDCTFSFPQLLENVGRRTDKSRGYILITPPLGDGELALIRRFEARIGQKVLLITAVVPETEVDA